MAKSNDKPHPAIPAGYISVAEALDSIRGTKPTHQTFTRFCDKQRPFGARKFKGIWHVSQAAWEGRDDMAITALYDRQKTIRADATADRKKGGLKKPKRSSIERKLRVSPGASADLTARQRDRATQKALLRLAQLLPVRADDPVRIVLQGGGATLSFGLTRADLFHP